MDAELAEGVGEEVFELRSQHAPGREVVAVTEAAGDDEDLGAGQEVGVGPQFGDVDAVGDRAGPGEGEGGLVVAVGAGGAEDDRGGAGHRGSRVGVPSL